MPERVDRSSDPSLESPGWSLADAVVALLLAFVADIAWTYVAALAYMRWERMASPPTASDLELLLQDGVFVGTSTCVVALITVLVVAWTVRRRRQSLINGLRLRWSGPFSWPIVVLFGLCLAVAEDLVAVSAGYPVVPMALRPLMRTPAAFGVFALSACLFAPAAEELFFRGLLYPALAHRLGVALAVAMTAIFFGLAHLSTYGADLFSVLLVIFSGYVLTLLRVFSGSTATGIVLHVTLNVYATVEAAILLVTRGL